MITFNLFIMNNYSLNRTNNIMALQNTYYFKRTLCPTDFCANLMSVLNASFTDSSSSNITATSGGNRTKFVPDLRDVN